MGLYAFDGTWNTEKSKNNTNKNTNVVRFKSAYGDPALHGHGALNLLIR